MYQSRAGANMADGLPLAGLLADSSQRYHEALFFFPFLAFLATLIHPASRLRQVNDLLTDTSTYH